MFVDEECCQSATSSFTGVRLSKQGASEQMAKKEALKLWVLSCGCAVKKQWMVQCGRHAGIQARPSVIGKRCHSVASKKLSHVRMHRSSFRQISVGTCGAMRPPMLEASTSPCNEKSKPPLHQFLIFSCLFLYNEYKTNIRYMVSLTVIPVCICLWVTITSSCGSLHRGL